MTGEAWELLVVGGGTAGIVAAKTAAGLGARVLLVERARTGGDCLWTGCVPSKALLAAAHAAADARAAARYGVHADVHIDFAAVRAHVQRAIAAIEPVDSPEALRAAGVQVLAGSLTFTGTDRAVVDGTPVRFRRALIGTGSSPAVPDIAGLRTALTADTLLTSDTFWDLTELPERILILGGGSIGCELGQASARLGAQVTLVEQGPRLLPAEDADAANLLHKALVADGIDVRVGTQLASVTEGQATLSGGSCVGFDAVLVATGRTPRTAGLGLPAAGVETDAHDYVVVDEHLRTSNPRIWAAGDVTGHPQFTHVAGVHASTAASNAVLGLRRKAADVFPRVTFTRPEIAAVGVPPCDAERDPSLTVRTIEHRDVDRAVAEDETAGRSCLVLDRRGRIVGASIVGPRAGESLAEVVLAISQRLRTRDVAGTMHVYPTYGDGVWNAAIADVRARLGSALASSAVTLLRRARR